MSSLQKSADDFFWAMGLMSGTSLDGIDAALIYTNGEKIKEWGPSICVPYTQAFRDQVAAITGDHISSDLYPSVEAQLTQLHIQVVKDLLQKAKFAPQDVRVVGFHGQTLWHKSPQTHGVGATCQIGDGPFMAKEVGIDVVYDFRSHDVAMGGEGAPLVPIYHHALARSLFDKEDLLFINIGGVANLTYVPAGGPEQMMAFDTGPGNGLINAWMQMKVGKPYDEGGKTARDGLVDALSLSLLKPLFRIQEQPPKSFDRLEIEKSVLESPVCSHWGLETGAATLTSLTAEVIGENVIAHLPSIPRKWLLSGGGRHNETLVRALQDFADARLPQGVRVEPIEALTVGGQPLDGDMIEAQAFAYLAARHLKGLPISFPGTTGVSVPQCGGILCAKEQ